MWGVRGLVDACVRACVRACMRECARARIHPIEIWITRSLATWCHFGETGHPTFPLWNASDEVLSMFHTDGSNTLAP